MIPYVLETARIRLRPLTDADSVPVPGGRCTGHPLHDRVPYRLAVCPAGSDDAVGYCGLVPEADRFSPEVYIAPAFRAQGFGTEAAVQFARWMPQRFGILRLDAPEDAAFLRRAGYRPGDAGLSADCAFAPPQDIPLSDGAVTLVRTRLDAPDVERGWTAAAFFDIRAGSRIVGACSLRIGYNEALFWSGHISYTVFPAFRGHGYAARAAALLREFAGFCGMPQVSVCCVPGNAASRRTAENAGFSLEGRFPIPQAHPLYAQGRREEALRFVGRVGPESRCNSPQNGV